MEKISHLVKWTPEEWAEERARRFQKLIRMRKNKDYRFKIDMLLFLLVLVFITGIVVGLFLFFRTIG